MNAQRNLSRKTCKHYIIRSCGLSREKNTGTSNCLAHCLQAAQKGFATRPQAEQIPEAYPLGYVEDMCEPRTTLGTFFSSRLSSCRLVGTCR
jgi:hypothetical protein